jgi:signal transduction histidine kinase
MRPTTAHASADGAAQRPTVPERLDDGPIASDRQRSRVPSEASRRFVDVAALRARRRHKDAQTLLDSILRDAGDLLRASRVAIMLYDAGTRTVEILDIGKPVFPGRIVHLGEGVAGRVIMSGRPLVIEDYENWPGKISGEIEGPPIVSALGVPLHSGTTPIGAMTVHSTDPSRRFTMGDAHILELFADIAMLALSHVSLYEEVRALNRRLERRVRERTHALQRSTEEIARKNEQLEELLTEVGQAQNEERRRIAQDIHDGVMQTLTGAVYELKALETVETNGRLVPGLRNVRNLLHQLEVELRGVIQDLRPVELQGAGLSAAIEDEARDLQTRYGIKCLVKVVGRRRKLPEPVEVAALRIVKEALRNAHLHADAAVVGVEVHFRQHEVQLVIRDDGIGFDPVQVNDVRPHLGISGMRRRAEGIGGSFVLESTPGAGTSIVASLPLDVPR